MLAIGTIGTLSSGISFSETPVFAWIRSADEIEVVTQPDPGTFNDFQILDGSGNSLAFEIISRPADAVILRLKKPLQNYKNYRVQHGTKSVYAHYSNEYVRDHLTERGPLGVQLSADGQQARFRLWSPTAEDVKLVLLRPGSFDVVLERSLQPAEHGTWSSDVSGLGNLAGLHYRYEVRAFGETRRALDPYARSMASHDPKSSDLVGTGVIVPEPAARPYSPKKGSARTVDFIGMEVHMRDASIHPSSGVPENERGTFLGLRPVLNHFAKLGVTHLQFLPLQAYISVDEKRRAYQDDRVPRAELNYNWGYDPQNFFTPDGWFSTNSSDPMARITELQSAVDAIHESGLGIILDVVYNHLGRGEVFEAAAPGMYLRRNRRGEISQATGAGMSLESRSPMVRRLILDSLQYWQRHFHIDGFRFDLMGFIDKETMQLIRDTLHPDTILYGEAWEFTDLPHDQATTKTQLPAAVAVSAFNDTSRDSYSGRNQAQGFVQGQTEKLREVRSGIVGAIKGHPQGHLIEGGLYHSFANQPFETLNYLSIHDGFTLWDKINLSIDASEETKMRMVRSSLAMLFTSQGRIILQAGDEFRRSKPLAANDWNQDRAHTAHFVIPNGNIRHFHENSYSSPDFTNALRWDQLPRFQSLNEYVQGLIAMRKALPALRFEDADSIRQNLQFFASEPTRALVAYTIDSRATPTLMGEMQIESLMVIHNAEKTEQWINAPQITDPNEWVVLADGQNAGIQPLNSEQVAVRRNEVLIARNCSTVLAKVSKRGRQP
jgi:pullulanase